MIDPDRFTAEGTLVPSPSGVNLNYSLSSASEEADMAHAEVRAMHGAYDLVKVLGEDRQRRVIRWLEEALGLRSTAVFHGEPEKPTTVADREDSGRFERQCQPEISVREFISRKKPDSLVERVACLGYYLAHYQDRPHFKTLDIVQLNTEAAAHKFGNPSRDMDNADRQNGYLVSAGHGLKQITPRGEAMVEALPDRGAVKAALRDHPFKPRKPRDSATKRAPRQHEAE